MKICSNESVIEKATNRTILIAGENEEVNKTYADYFNNNGFNVVGITCDGDQALWYVECFKPQYILLGLLLKSADGIEVLRCIQQSDIHCTIIMQSALKDERILIETINCGAKYFFTLPSDASVIKDMFLRLTHDKECIDYRVFKSKEKTTKWKKPRLYYCNIFHFDDDRR